MTGTVQGADRELIERYYAAMRVGASASDDMLALFADDAVYTEPFGGEPVTHVGKDAIRRSFGDSQRSAPREMVLTLDRVDVERDQLRTVWTCTSPAFPQPMRGQDLWTIRNGKIQRLETQFLLS